MLRASGNEPGRPPPAGQVTSTRELLGTAGRHCVVMVPVPQVNFLRSCDVFDKVTTSVNNRKTDATRPTRFETSFGTVSVLE